MTMWLLAAVVLLLGLVPLLYVLLRADTMSRLIALEVAYVNVALVLLLLAKHFDRSFYADQAVVVALLSFPGGLAFVRMLERDL